MTFTQKRLCCEGMPEGIPCVTAEDVRVFVWNCRGIARASFCPNLFTIRSMTNSQVIVLTDTRAAGKNARSLLNEATAMKYFYTEPLGFVGGTSVLWDTSEVALAGLTGEDNYVSFRVRVTMYLAYIAPIQPFIVCICPCTNIVWLSLQQGII